MEFSLQAQSQGRSISMSVEWQQYLAQSNLRLVKERKFLLYHLA